MSLFEGRNIFNKNNQQQIRNCSKREAKKRRDKKKEESKVITAKLRKTRGEIS